MIHHGTIRKYTAALLDLFNDMEIQYEDSVGNTLSRNIPIRFSSAEKARVLSDYDAEQLMSGNTNVLPRASLSVISMAKAEQRTTNKNVKIATIQGEDTFEYMYNSVPYEFTFQVDVQCRGMNEATMIIEQIAPKFNPTVEIDIWDASNLDEPTRIPIRLLDISIEEEDYDTFSSNVMNIGFGLSIMGNLYPPIKTVDRIKEFKMYINQQDGNFYEKKTIMGWDVDDNGELENAEMTQVSDASDQYPPQIIDITASSMVIGNNDLTVIYDDKDNKLSELTFNWTVISGSAIIDGDLDRAVLDVSAVGDIEVQVTITDVFGNYTTLAKTFTV